MLRNSYFRNCFFVFILLALSSCSNKNQDDGKNNLDTALGVQKTLLSLNFEYKPGYIGTKFVDSEKKSSLTNFGGKASKQVAKLTIDKIEYIQNYIFQQKDPSFMLLEGRDLLIRIHAYANISNIAAPDMRIVIEGPDNKKFSERLEASGGLPPMPENSNQNVDYLLTPFTQAYLYKIPAASLTAGKYTIKLDPLIKNDSGLLVEKQTKEFEVFAEPNPLNIVLYKGLAGEKSAKLPSTEKIIAALRKYWPLGKINIETTASPIAIEAFETKELTKMADEVKPGSEEVFPTLRYPKLLRDTVGRFNETRNFTKSEAIQVLFAPIPIGSVHHMQSIIVSEEDWEHQLLKQMGHAMGLGVSKGCIEHTAGNPADRDAKDVQNNPQELQSDPNIPAAFVGDKEEFTLEPMDNYLWERRYWTVNWGEKNAITLNTYKENDLMSVCKNSRLPHPYFYRTAYKNLTDSAKQDQLMLKHPSKIIHDSYASNGLSHFMALHVAMDYELLRKALIKHEFNTIPDPDWRSDGELKRLILNDSMQSPHSIELENSISDGSPKKNIGLYLSKDKKSLVGVADFFDLPSSIKEYNLLINKTPIKKGIFYAPYNRKGSAAAKALKKDGYYLFAWNAKEIYNTMPSTLLFKTPGQKAEILGITLTRGVLNIPTKNVPSATAGKFYLMLPMFDPKLQTTSLDFFVTEFNDALPTDKIQTDVNSVQ